MTDFSQADLSTRTVTDPFQADFAIEGDGSSGPGSSCDYTPYCLDTNASDPDTVILGLAPFAYYPMDDASGLIQDASGNGNHASSVSGTPLYAQSPITTKAGNSIRFNGAHFVIPKPAVMDGAHAWSVVWLERVAVFRGTGSPSQASPMLGIAETGKNGPLPVINSASGDLYVIWQDNGLASFFPESNLIGRAAIIALTAGPGNSQPQLYVDGVRWGAAQSGANPSLNNLTVGRSDDGFWGWPDHRMSNLSTWDKVLTHAQIITITEALADAALFAGAVTL